MQRRPRPKTRRNDTKETRPTFVRLDDDERADLQATARAEQRDMSKQIRAALAFFWRSRYGRDFGKAA